MMVSKHDGISVVIKILECLPEVLRIRQLMINLCTFQMIIIIDGKDERLLVYTIQSRF